MDKPRFDYCENCVKGPMGLWCIMWNTNLKKPCYHDSVCNSNNMIDDDKPAYQNCRALFDGRY